MLEIRRPTAAVPGWIVPPVLHRERSTKTAPSARCAALAMRQARGRREVAVQDKRIEVGAVGPHDRPQLIIHTNLREKARVGKRLEHGTVQLPGEINITGTVIAEAKPQSIVAENLDGCDPHEVHHSILRQRVDRLRGATPLRANPVRLQLRTMQRRPLAHELERTNRQLAYEHRASFDRDHRMMLSVLSMEMGRFVIVEVHRDHDAVEDADPGHDIIMVSAWDGTLGDRLSASDAISNNNLVPAKTGMAGRCSKSPWPLIRRLHEERFSPTP